MPTSFGQLLHRNSDKIYEYWMTSQLVDNRLRDDLMSLDELRAQSKDLLDALLRALRAGNTTDTGAAEYQPVQEQLRDLSLSRARQGFALRETAQYVLSLKAALGQLLEHELAKDPLQLYAATQAVSQLLDSLSMTVMETYVKGREDVIARQTMEMNEISTPVIRLWEGILALPIIGTLDSARTQTVMENLLQEIVNTGSSIAILDISGVPAVDSLVAQHLIKTVSATRLMGAECIISGIRPEIAQTIVHLGIDLSLVQTKATLASALKLAYQMLGVEVRKVAPRVG